MSKKAFDKIADGLTDAIGLAKSGALEVPHKAGETLIVDNEKKVVARVTMRPVPTDKGIEGLAEIAQKALSVDYGAAKGAIADAQAALKRVIKRAEAAEGEHFEIKTSRGPTVSFNGKLLCDHEFEAGERTRLAIYIAIYQTNGGALVAESSSLLANGGGKELIDTIVVEVQDDVKAMQFAIMDFFDWAQGARNMVTKKLKWSLRRDVD